MASDRVTAPIRRVVDDFRRRWGLAAHRRDDESFSSRAQICQLPKTFDFPRTALPPSFHYVGPLRDRAKPIPFPWERLDGRPLIYASLGTLQNGRAPLFECFAEACEPLDVQLIISHGGGLTASQVARFRGNPVVVPYAPQQEVIGRAALTLTHAGLNTVLDSLSAGVPLVAVPITYEQPAIGRRLERAGVGRVVRLRHANAGAIRSAVRDVLARAEFKRASQKMAEAIRESGGLRRAADHVVQSCR
jgi:MGT family glycosyltransferase